MPLTFEGAELMPWRPQENELGHEDGQAFDRLQARAWELEAVAGFGGNVEKEETFQAPLERFSECPFRGLF